MAKVRLLAVLTMDGCPADTTGLSGQWLGSDRYGISALKESAICILNENTSLTLLYDRSEDPDLSDRSHRKDIGHHQRHDTDAACG